MEEPSEEEQTAGYIFDCRPDPSDARFQLIAIRYYLPPENRLGRVISERGRASFREIVRYNFQNVVELSQLCGHFMASAMVNRIAPQIIAAVGNAAPQAVTAATVVPCQCDKCTAQRSSYAAVAKIKEPS